MRHRRLSVTLDAGGWLNVLLTLRATGMTFSGPRFGG